ncbi:glucosidase II beta subunit-like protein [Zymoseptoria tritici IPO323]|uniref:Endoplasmic reticulum lectin n=1 Tax=Zymoseptoria tritici (strain CBS 115943 / IPO323) TaxID=336722 RepID=F9X0D4_ZYMTI|nr:glucosidase II beta subunit-like protein [Zymoseptoria tritici IPO323]EGP91523.1 glucosidase II beta subunit-like protein [Zymoseptoria tritici IPO323]
MRYLLALPAVLRAAVLLASASQHSFSVQDDLLAFPQYEVRFQDEWTSEAEAHSKLSNNGKPHDHLRHEHQKEQYELQQRLGSTTDGDPAEPQPVEYERLVLDGHSWLCEVPIVKKKEETPNVNDTQTKAEEEKELARATDRGWELLSGMEDSCIFFIGGWWSYRFCYNQGVKQFHQLPLARGVPNYPPQEDPSIPGFTLGTYSKGAEDEDDHKDETSERGSALDKSGGKRTRGGHGELVQHGESRYLVQTLGGGTRCDLTGKERVIEIQYHCNPQSADRISLIKETSTCAYLMVIQTPRLCNDVAFQPPQKDQPNTVSCSPILSDDEVEAYEHELAEVKDMEREIKEQDEADPLGGSVFPPPLPVGDIIVGGHALVPPGKKIEKSSIVGGGVYVETLATSDGKMLSKEDLKKLGLPDMEAVEKLRKELEKYAKGEQWKLDVVDTPAGREYRAIVGSDDDEKPASQEGTVKAEKKEQQQGQEKDVEEPVKLKEGKEPGKLTEGKAAGKRKDVKGHARQQDSNPRPKQEEEETEQEGSQEEFFRDEL